MRVMSQRPTARLLLVMLTATAAGSLSAQSPDQSAPEQSVTVTAPLMVQGPEIKGVITARHDDKIKVTTADGSSRIIQVNDTTRINARGGFFGTSAKLAANQLMNGIPVDVRTMQPRDAGGDAELVASRIDMRNTDFKTASMIRAGTAQGFEEQTAATEALRGRMGDIDKYNIKGTTNVHFDTGKSNLSDADKAQLCQTASQAEGQENALMLVVGYTDSTGGDDLNQALSEKRAARVINYLQQACGWKPYRMLTPTGMAKADPLADNSTPEGKAENRRVAVNILVSKSVDGL